MTRIPRSTGTWTAVALALWAARTCSGAGHVWSEHPADYPRINRVQASGGVVTYAIDLSGFVFSRAGHYPPELIDELEAAAGRAFEKWNQVLAPIGLRFERRPVGPPTDIPVFALAYDVIIPTDVFGDTVAGSLAFPLNGVMNFAPIVLNVDEQFLPLDLRPTITDGGLHHPYLRYVGLDGICLYTTVLHEIGHQFGIGHPQEMYARARNYGFLSLETVQVDATCLSPSDFVGSENLLRRGRFIATEIDSVMAPLQIGATATDLPPEDRAAAAFILREVNPTGADEMLSAARELLRQTDPLRFANVVPEYEFEPGVRADNDTPERAIPIEVGSIVLGSIARPTSEDGQPDVDFYQFVVSPADVGREFLFDIDMGGGLSGSNWVDAVLELYDADGTLLQVSDDTNETDPGSISVMDPFLRWVPEQSGPYRLRVGAAPGPFQVGGVGDYELKVGRETVPEPSGNGPHWADPSVESCSFEPLEARPLGPVCGLLDVMSVCGGAVGWFGLQACVRRVPGRRRGVHPGCARTAAGP